MTTEQRNCEAAAGAREYDRAAWLADPRRAILWPLLCVSCLSGMIYLGDVDLSVARAFHRSPNQWPWADSSIPRFIYEYGTLPGWLLCLGGLLVGVLAWPLSRRVARCGLFLFLVVALGPGLMINGFLKPNWHRPRPNQVAQFGGAKEYVSALVRGSSDTEDTYKSFPCGHASMGFALAAPAFLLLRRHPRWALAFLVVGVIAGLSLGTARVVQGRHFVSDVVWSTVPVYSAGLFAYFVLGLHQDDRVLQASNGRIPPHDAPIVFSFAARCSVTAGEALRSLPDQHPVGAPCQTHRDGSDLRKSS